MTKKKTKKEIAKILINKDLETISDDELIDMILDEGVAIDVDKEADNSKKVSHIMADLVTKVAGSWTFIICFTMFLILWVVLNIFFIEVDPFPFILLNLVLSCIAALQAPIIMMSQNREAERERKRNHNDYKTDLKSELILEALYDHIEELQRNQRKILRILEEKSAETEKKVI